MVERLVNPLKYQENENMENVTDEEITKAKKVLEKAKQQNKDNELESFKI